MLEPKFNMNLIASATSRQPDKIAPKYIYQILYFGSGIASLTIASTCALTYHTVGYYVQPIPPIATDSLHCRPVRSGLSEADSIIFYYSKYTCLDQIGT